MRPLRTAYCTLNRIVQRLNADSSSIQVNTTSAQNTQINTESDNFQAEMKDCIYKASDLITQSTNNVFVPYQATYTWRGYEYRKAWRYDREIAAYILRLPDRLLSVTTFTLAGTAHTTTDYYLRPEGEYPSKEIALYSDVSFTLPSANTETIALVGTWGFHSQPSLMWASSGATVQNNPLSSSATTVTVSDISNIEVFQYIKIDSEYLLTTAISGTTVTVQRGVNGSTAASHTQGTAIYTYEPIEAIADECARLAIRRYQLRSGMEFIPVGDGALAEIKTGNVQLPDAYRQYYVGSA